MFNFCAVFSFFISTTPGGLSNPQIGILYNTDGLSTFFYCCKNLTKVPVCAIFCSLNFVFNKKDRLYKVKLLDFYRECVALVRRDLAKQKMLLPPDAIADLCEQHHRQHRSLIEKLNSADNTPHKIFAVQKAFPRTGAVRADFDALALAKNFESQKAAALAVVTEKHFYCGEPSMLTGVAHMVNLPIIRWDFITDVYQLMQSKLWGADAVRVIVPLLDQVELTEIYEKASLLGLEIIWELHSEADAGRIAEFTQAAVIYIDGDELELAAAENIVKTIPQNSPALLNGDLFDLSADAGNAFAGAIYFAPR